MFSQSSRLESITKTYSNVLIKVVWRNSLYVCVCVFVCVCNLARVLHCMCSRDWRTKRKTHHQPGHESEEDSKGCNVGHVLSCLLSNLTPPAHSKIQGEFRLLLIFVSYICSFRYMFRATKLKYCSFLFDLIMSKTCLARLITTTFLNNWRHPFGFHGRLATTLLISLLNLCKRPPLVVS